jgi:type VII secretion-associated serine protease mycosin
MLTARAAGRRLSLGCALALTAASGAAVAGAETTPAAADTVRDAQQWVLDAVDAPAAWPVTQGQGVVVAVIDSGVTPTVSDLAGSVVSGPDYSGVSTKPSDINWGMHGTWMASLIAGHGHDGENGISGVAPRAKILSIRVLPDKKDPAFRQYEHEPSRRGQRALARAIRYAVAHRAGVISMSLGYGSSSHVVRSALQRALAHKVVVVASSGNSGDTSSNQARAYAPDSFPADYPGVLGVAAVDREGDPANFSSDNLSVQVAAPGVQVPAQGNDGQYWLVSGTSPACALTSGVAALIKSVYPRLSPALVVRAITSSAQDRPAAGYDDQVGFGTVDAAAALAAAKHLISFGKGRHGLSPASHFGGGPSAVPPPPVGPRGLSRLVLFCLLAFGCLAMTAAAARRLVLGRARGAGNAAALASPAGPDGARGNGAGLASMPSYLPPGEVSFREVPSGDGSAFGMPGLDDRGGIGPGASQNGDAADSAGQDGPEAAREDAAVPDATVPDIAVPDIAVPDTAVPDTAVPGRPQPAPGDGE